VTSLEGTPATDAGTAGAGLAERALQHYDLRDARPELLVESFNTIYRVHAAVGSFVLRVGPPYRIHRPGAAEAEAALIQQVSADRIAAPTVVRTRDGRAAVTVDDRDCMLLHWVPGRPVSRPTSVADAAGLGALAARLHAVPDTTRSDGALDGRSVLLFDIPDHLGELGARYGSLFRDAYDRAHAAVERLYATPGAARTLHGDLTPNNVVRSSEGLVAIDYQDLLRGRVEQDLAHTLFALMRDDDADGRLVTAFRTAYERTRPWPEIDPDLFIARRLQLVNLVLFCGRDDLPNHLDRHAAALRAV
jgi:Ser/Thr protein kinase RdoA (MazF antagonist)